MRHLIFLILHMIALLFGAVFLFITIPAHLIYAAVGSKIGDPTLRTLTVVIAGTATLAASGAFAGEWNVVGTQGMMQFVLVSKAREADKQFFEETAKTLCGSRRVCQIMFWTDKKFVPFRSPFTDAQLSNQVAQYNHNQNTGFVQLLLNCRIDPNPDRCFK